MRVILDCPHGEVILEPVASLDAPFPFDASGLSPRATGPELERVVIDGIAPGAAGARAALAVGDVLERVDGRTVDGAALDWVHETLARAGADVMLRVARNGEVRDVMLALASDLDDATAWRPSA